MNFKVNRNQLLQALQHTRCHLPSFSINYANHYKITLNGDKLYITGVNLLLFITESIPLEETPTDAQEPQTFYIHATTLVKAIKALDNQPLEFLIEEYQLTVRHADGYFQLPIIDSMSFPEPKPMTQDEALHLHMEAPGLYSQLSKVAFATASEEDMRPALSAVFMEIEKDRINYTATDGRLLVSLVHPCKQPNAETGQLLMPRKVADALLKVLPKTGYCDLYVQGLQAMIIMEDNIVIRFGCVDSKFPNYRSVLPEEFSTHFDVDRRQILKTLDRIGLFCSEARRVKINLEGDNLTFRTQDLEENMLSSEHIPCQVTKRSDFFSRGILCNIRMLGRLIRSTKSDRVMFNVVSSERAFTITPMPESDLEHITLLLMPMMQDDND